MDKENHSRPQTPTVKLLPPGSSKVLRRHHLESTQRRKHLRSGPVRVTTPSSLGRLGYDGTYQTPSKELLKSTLCSRRQRIDDSSPLNIVLQEQSLVGCERQDCINPMAFTLWNEEENSSPAAVGTQPPAFVARPLPMRPQNVMIMLS